MEGINSLKEQIVGIPSKIKFAFKSSKEKSFMENLDLYFKSEEGKRTVLARYDLNNDDFPDLIVGNYRGGLSFFKGDLNSSVTEIPSHNKLLIFPNPAKNQVLIRFKNESSYQISVFNKLGQLIYTKENSNESDFQLNVENWNNGHYSVQIDDGKNRYHQSLIILH